MDVISLDVVEDATRDIHSRASAVEVESVLGGRSFPIGEWLSHSSVFVEARGRVVAAGMGWIWELGSSVEESLELAVTADRPLLCLHSDPGLDPWPTGAGAEGAGQSEERAR